MSDNSLISINDIEKMGTAIAVSGLFGKTQEQAVALMLIAQAEGLHPAVAARDYDIIQGKPALKSKAKMGRFQKSGGKIEWIERNDSKCSAYFSHPQSPSKISVEWDIARAQSAGLMNKDNWKKFPRQMLSARVISEGVDATYPDCASNMYVSEEVEDFEDKTTSPVIETSFKEVKSSIELAKEIKILLESNPENVHWLDFKTKLCEIYNNGSMPDIIEKHHEEIAKNILNGLFVK